MNGTHDYYEAPSAQVLEVNMKTGLLQASLDAERRSYGEAIHDTWD